MLYNRTVILSVKKMIWFKEYTGQGNGKVLSGDEPLLVR
jgi:hypothetical protein